jgi:hypothetical protein
VFPLDSGKRGKLKFLLSLDGWIGVSWWWVTPFHGWNVKVLFRMQAFFLFLQAFSMKPTDFWELFVWFLWHFCIRNGPRSILVAGFSIAGYAMLHPIWIGLLDAWPTRGYIISWICFLIYSGWFLSFTMPLFGRALDLKK